ncbi:MAG: HNH endonuclease [Actinobacteria bacterium]|nr:HNH endonuclease [Actinomycetota bacterium]
MGRTRRIVPDRTRVAVEHRDGGCRVPGCDRRRWLQVHHIVHWEDGGPTDTPNLVALCSRHHRLHHQGRLGISGDSDDPDGLEFTDHAGRRLTGCGRPAPSGELVLTATYAHPTGERLDGRWVQFHDPPGTPPPQVVTDEAPDVWRTPTEESFGWWIPWPEPATAGEDDESWGADQDLTYA